MKKKSKREEEEREEQSFEYVEDISLSTLMNLFEIKSKVQIGNVYYVHSVPIGSQFTGLRKICVRHYEVELEPFDIMIADNVHGTKRKIICLGPSGWRQVYISLHNGLKFKEPGTDMGKPVKKKTFSPIVKRR
jgi:hypothetical protein